MASPEAVLHRKHHAPAPRKHASKQMAALGLLLIADVTLTLCVIKKYWFVSLSFGAYFWVLWDFVSLWAGRIVTIIGAVTPILIALAKRRSSKRVSPDGEQHQARLYTDKILHFFLDKIPAYLKRPKVFSPILLALVVPIPPLVYWLFVPKLPFPIPPSAVAMSNDGREIYVAYQPDEIHGKLLIYDAGTGKESRDTVDVGGKPHRITVAKDGKIFVVDESQDSVSEVDPDSRSIIQTFSVHPLHLPHAAVVGPDAHKLYIAVAEPTPQGVIQVIDLDKSKGYPSHLIEDVNCPEGLALSQDGGKLYVASQCGAGQDPVFAIDTKSEVVKPVPGFAVGLDLAIAREGKRVYVARGGFARRDPNTGSIVSVPPQLSAIDTGTLKEVPTEALVLRVGQDEKSQPETPGLFAVTPDGKYLLVGVGSSVRIINTENYHMNTIELETPPAGIAVGTPHGKTSLQCYVWLPQSHRLFFTGLSGLLPD